MSELEAGEMVIEKVTVAVEICTEKGQLVRGEVFLLPQRGSDRGERLLDVMTQRWFIPVKTVERLLFVAVRHITWVKLDLLAGVDELDADAENDANSCQARLMVELVDGGRIEGNVRYSMPNVARRVGDYLEHLPMFFAVTTEDFVYLISTNAIVSVTALEERR